MNLEANPGRLGNSVSKIKILLSKAAERSFDVLWAAIGCIIETIGPRSAAITSPIRVCIQLNEKHSSGNDLFAPCKPLLFGFWMGDLDIRRT